MEHGSDGAALTVMASLVSFFLLVFSMRRLPLGTAYAIWHRRDGRLFGGHCRFGRVRQCVAGCKRCADCAGRVRPTSDEQQVISGHKSDCDGECRTFEWGIGMAGYLLPPSQGWGCS